MLEGELLREGNITISRESGISTDVIDFLDSIVWGTNEALYQHKNTVERIKKTEGLNLLVLRKEGKIAATAVFINRRVMAGNRELNFYCIRYFASSREIRGTGIVKKYGNQIMGLIRKGEEEKTVFIGYIEGGNARSYNMAQKAGYKEIASVKTIGFSRFFPKQDPRVSRLENPAGQQEMLQLLKHHYRKHNLVNFNSCFLDNNYFVLRQGGEIIAGVQAHKALWVVNNLPGISGKLITRVLPRIPVLNKIFNPEKFEFLAFEGIYHKKGREKELAALMESVLATFKLNSALFWFDKASPFFKELNSSGKMGLLNRFVGSRNIYIVAAFENLENEEIEKLQNKPVFISGFDFI